MSEKSWPITIKLTNKRGLDPKVASEMAVVATACDCDEVTLTWNSRTADARSIVALLSLGAEHGDMLRLQASGRQAQQALDGLIAIIQK